MLRTTAFFEELDLIIPASKIDETSTKRRVSSRWYPKKPPRAPELPKTCLDDDFIPFAWAMAGATGPDPWLNRPLRAGVERSKVLLKPYPASGCPGISVEYEHLAKFIKLLEAHRSNCF